MFQHSCLRAATLSALALGLAPAAQAQTAPPPAPHPDAAKPVEPAAAKPKEPAAAKPKEPAAAKPKEPAAGAAEPAAPLPATTAGEMPATAATDDSAPTGPPPAVVYANPQDAAQARPAPQAQPAIVEPPVYANLEPPQRDALSLAAIYYNTAAPLGDTRDFAGGFSWWGVSFDLRQKLQDKVSGGLSVAWQSFAYKTWRTTTLGAVTVTGTQSRYQTTLPILLTGHYYIRDNPEAAMPFVGMGIGGYHVTRTLDIGPLARFSDSSWHLGFAPEIGISFPSRTGALMLATKFHYAFTAGDAPHQMYFNFNLGASID